MIEKIAQGRTAPLSGKIGTDGANPSMITTAVNDGFLHPDPIHYVTKHLQQGIESDRFRVKKNMPKIGGSNPSKPPSSDCWVRAVLWINGERAHIPDIVRSERFRWMGVHRCDIKVLISRASASTSGLVQISERSIPASLSCASLSERRIFFVRDRRKCR
jgi:hypothetical protein